MAADTHSDIQVGFRQEACGEGDERSLTGENKRISVMLNHQGVKIQHCLSQLSHAYKRNYSNTNQEVGHLIVCSARLSLEHIGKSNAPYHDVEHTVLVTLAGQAILEGRMLSEGEVTPKDWAHFIIALLFHDIGYVKGICKADRGSQVATGVGDGVVELPRGSTDASLAPYHVDRGKLFVNEWFDSESSLKGLIDPETIASYIETTRFPFPKDDGDEDTHGYRGLVRAADLIGQLGDPNRLQKCTALFSEFEEIGLNAKLGYERLGDLISDNDRFYHKMVSPYIQNALRYLRITQEGRQWIANLQANVEGAVI